MLHVFGRMYGAYGIEELDIEEKPAGVRMARE
jgi:hypothetical protein